MTQQFRHIRRAALSHHKTVVRSFHKSHRHARRLMQRHQVVLHKVRDHSLRTAAVASLSTGLLATPALLAHTAQVQAQGEQPDIQKTLDANSSFAQPVVTDFPTFGTSLNTESKRTVFADRINKVAPEGTSNLTTDQSAAVSQVIKETFNILATDQLEGVKLKDSRGIMAGEQHLPLYPGDKVTNFYRNRITGEIADPTASQTGMVPGKPSYMSGARSASEVTKQDVDREQWYVAVQTFLVQGFQQNPNKFYNFFKFRKMLAINQKTGQAIVVDISDAGPSQFTGRIFGGNNPVLIGLGLGEVRTGNILMLFVDDPNDTIPLGPLTGYNP